MKYAYRLGKAVMLPVACLPVAGLLMGVGFWLDPVGQGENLLLAHVMILAGTVLIDNMSLLFTLGVAVGLADEVDGSVHTVVISIALKCSADRFRSMAVVFMH